MQISQKDVQVLNVLGRGASSVVSPYRLDALIVSSTVMLAGVNLPADLLQVMKAFYLKGNAFVAIKKINAFEKVRLSRVTSC